MNLNQIILPLQVFNTLSVKTTSVFVFVYGNLSGFTFLPARCTIWIYQKYYFQKLFILIEILFELFRIIASIFIWLSPQCLKPIKETQNGRLIRPWRPITMDNHACWTMTIFDWILRICGFLQWTKIIWFKPTWPKWSKPAFSRSYDQ